MQQRHLSRALRLLIDQVVHQNRCHPQEGACRGDPEEEFVTEDAVLFPEEPGEAGDHGVHRGGTAKRLVAGLTGVGAGQQGTVAKRWGQGARELEVALVETMQQR